MSKLLEIKKKVIDFYGEDKDNNWLAIIFNIGKNENNK